MTGAALPPVPQHSRELAALWQDELAASRMIIILDDAPDAAAIAPLLPTVSSCAVLITTRHSLPGIAGASEFTLGPLPERDAATLFTLTAGTGSTSDPEAVAQVVRSLSRLPLAVTLAASRLREEGGPSTVIELINNVTESGRPPRCIRRGRRAAPVRAGGVLHGADRGPAAVLPAPGTEPPCLTFTTESAAAVAGVPVPRAREMTGKLLERHLAECAAGDRIKLHDLLRTYAAFCAKRDSPRHEQQDAKRRLLDYLEATR